MRPKVIFVTDPLCSWCWGMAGDIERMRGEAADAFDFDVLLGGINVGSTQPVTEFARVRLASIWRTVIEVTGARFGAGLPGGDFIYNSMRACVAVESVRSVRDAPPFDYLLGLQQRFFVDGVDVTDPAVQRVAATEFGIDGDAFDSALIAPTTQTRVRDGFALAKSYGTAALPSVLLDVDGQRRLVAGGYVDAPTLRETLDRLLSTRGPAT